MVFGYVVCKCDKESKGNSYLCWIHNFPLGSDFVFRCDFSKGKKKFSEAYGDSRTQTRWQQRQGKLWHPLFSYKVKGQTEGGHPEHKVSCRISREIIN